jgi:hypothetical protein
MNDMAATVNNSGEEVKENVHNSTTEPEVKKETVSNEFYKEVGD